MRADATETLAVRNAGLVGRDILLAFLMEDFLGAGFFHLVLGPAIAAPLGLLGAAAGAVTVKLRR